jgi:Tol biopolymer transport system component
MIPTVWRLARTCILTSAAISILMLFGAQTARAETSIAGYITYVGTDANIYYCDAKCSQPKCITCKGAGAHVQRGTSIVDATWQVQLPGIPEQPGRPDENAPQTGAEYGWPTFSPDGKMLAYSSETHKKDGTSYAVWVYDIARQSPIEIFESRTERVIYLVWLNDGQHLSFLLGEPRGMSLMLAEKKESAPVRIVTTGLPLYFAWGATPDLLALHFLALNSERTEQVELMSLTPTSQNIDKVLSSGRTPFKNPSWSPDGKHIAYVASYHAESNIVVADAQGKNPRSVVSLPVGENSVIWAPDSKHLAYSTAITAQNPVYHGIKLVDVADASSKWLTKSDVAAYFFSPDSQHMLYIGVPEEKPYYTWSVIDIKSGTEKALGNFLTTVDESTVYRYFDQIALSHQIWSPDSKAFIFAGVRLEGDPDRTLAVSPPPIAWVMPIDGSAPHQISTAVLAFFSPASK